MKKATIKKFIIDGVEIDLAPDHDPKFAAVPAGLQISPYSPPGDPIVIQMEKPIAGEMLDGFFGQHTVYLVSIKVNKGGRTDSNLLRGFCRQSVFDVIGTLFFKVGRRIVDGDSVEYIGKTI